MKQAQFTGKHIIRLAETPSTNQYAWRLLSERPPEGTVVLAYDQTQGRGQKGNHWLAAPGLNLTLSIIYYPTFLSGEKIFELSKICSLAVQACVQSLLPYQDVRIKWPNDLLVNGRKVAGMLIENQWEQQQLRASVIGIGLNVNQISFPDELKASASSLRAFQDRDWDLETVREQLCYHLEQQYLQLRSGRTAAIAQHYLKHLYGYQESLRFQIGDQYVQATLAGVDQAGRLVLEQHGKLHRYDLKEIVFLPPA